MSEQNPLILMVEDEQDLARLNARFLKRKGYEVIVAHTAAEARKLFAENEPDLFVFDVELPDGDGFSLCEEFRQDTDAPVLFLTGMAETKDKITGLRSGGDYYITKPYDNDELAVVVESLLRREEQMRKKIAEISVIERGPLTLKTQEGKAYMNDVNVGLTSKEFAILVLLIQNEEKGLSNETIYKTVWEMDMGTDTGVIRKHISTIRKKLDVENLDEFDILSEYGGMYRFTTN